MAANTTYIDLRRDTPPFDGSQTALIEFNPLLLPLTSDLDDKLLGYITGRSHPDISNEEAKKAKYLSIARASNGPHSCGAHMQRYDHGVREHTYLSLAVPSIANTPVTPASIGMTANSTGETAEELAILVTPLLMEKFRFKDDAEPELLHQAQLFFEKSGITNYSLYAYMATQAWPLVKTVKEPLALITHPITTLLSEIAGYVELALNENYHLEGGV